MTMDSRITITSIEGNCPVQSEGMVDGKPFYFRARGSLTLDVADRPDGDPVAVGCRDGEPGWHWDGTYDPQWITRSGATPGERPYYGWMAIEDASACIETVLTQYLAGPVDGQGGWKYHRG